MGVASVAESCFDINKDVIIVHYISSDLHYQQVYMPTESAIRNI